MVNAWLWAMKETHTAAKVESARHFIAGLGSGLASAVILQPFDLLKTRVQQSGRPSLSVCLREARQSPHAYRVLWRGTVPSALRTSFGSALYLTCLNAIRQHVQQTGCEQRHRRSQSTSSVLPALTNTTNLISGAMARTIAGFILMPLTVIKVRFESSLYTYPSLWAAAGDIRRTDGLRGFFSGFGATALRDAPYAGTYVAFYELLKVRLSLWASLASSSPYSEPSTMQATVPSLVNFSSAILAGAACAFISNPFDAIKTRIQLQPRRYGNVWRASCLMVFEDGFRSFWDGLALRMSRKAVGSALAWTIYEELIRRFRGSGRSQP